MAMLAIGRDELLAIEALRDLAVANPVHMPDVLKALKTADGKKAHMARMTSQTITLPVGYLVTYSVETGHGAGICRHLSMSVDRPGKLPSPEAVWGVARELGFIGDLGDCTIWLEDLHRGGAEKQEAVNIVQPVVTGQGGTA